MFSKRYSFPILLAIFTIIISSFAFAEHTADAYLSPEYSAAGENIEYSFLVCNNGPDPIDEVRAFNTPLFDNFVCGEVDGWELLFIPRFLNHDDGEFCWYFANESNIIESGECRMFNFTADVEKKQCVTEFNLETRDQETQGSGVYITWNDTTLIDDEDPVIEKILGEPKAEVGGDSWITQSTPITIHAYDESSCNPPSGIDYCEYRYDVDGDEELAWTEIDWNSSAFVDGTDHYYYTFYYPGDSEHFLEIRCFDNAGRESYHSQTDYVDSYAPETNKSFIGPQKIDGYVEWIDGVTTIDLSRRDPDPTGEGCNSGVVDTIYLNVLAESYDFCYHPEDYCHISPLQYDFCSGWGCLEGMDNDFFVTGRYGDGNPTAGAWELGIWNGSGSETLEEEDDFGFPNGGPVSFSLKYDPTTGMVTYIVGEKTLEWNYESDKAFEYLLFFAKGNGAGNTADLTGLQLNGEDLPNLYSGDGYEGLLVPMRDNQQAAGFVVSGFVELTWGDPSNEIPGFHVYALNTHDLLEDWKVYPGTPIQKENESCHILYYFSYDEVGNVENLNMNCFFVDKTPPNVTKITGSPRVPLDEPLGGGPNWWVTSETNITFTCEDQDPHPSGDEELCFMVSYDLDPDGYMTDEYCSKYGGYEEADWCCMPIEGEFVFNFNEDEDSLHDLEYFCRDAVNKSSETHLQYYRVDTIPPSINKTMLGIEGEHWIGDCPPTSPSDVCYVSDNGIGGVHVDVEDGGENCASGISSCYYYVEWEGQVIDSDEFGSEGVDIVFFNDSTHNLTVNCIDRLGNVMGEDVESFLVDSTPPVTVKEYGTPFVDMQEMHWITSETPITFNATDNKVGVDEIRYRYCFSDCYSQQMDSCSCEGENWTIYSGDLTTFYIPEDSEHCIEFYSVDRFGYEEDVQSQCVYVDNMAPVGNKTISQPKLECTFDPDMIITESFPIVQNNLDPAIREGDVYDGPQLVLQPLGAGPNPCDSASEPSQCAYVPSTSLPPYVLDTIEAEGGNLTAGCGNILILSSGDPLDADTELSTDMDNPGCGNNPDGYATNDCVILEDYTPNGTAIVLATSSEWAEWVGSSFTDWMQITDGASVNVSINDWGTANIIPYDPAETGTKTLASISSTVTMRVADSGDSIYDTILIVVPLECFEEEPQPLLCGNGKLEPGEECDDGNHMSGDGCSAICTIEENVTRNETYDCWWVRDHVTNITLTCEDPMPHPVGQETVCYRISFDNESMPWLTDQYCEEFGGEMEDGWCCDNIAGTEYKFTFVEDSVHDLEFFCKDQLNNVEEETDIEYFKVDSVAPVTTKTYLGPYYNNSGIEYIDTASTVQLVAEDGGEICHVDGVEIYYNYTLVDDSFCLGQCEPIHFDGNMADMNARWNLYDGAFPIPEESCHLIEYFSEDALGNTEMLNYECVFVDKSVPNITTEYLGPYYEEEGVEWISSETLVNVSAVDVEPHPSGVKEVRYRYAIVDDDNCWEECTATGSGSYTVYEQPFNIPEDSCHLIEVEAEDNVGKTAYHKQCVFVDNTPPSANKTVYEPKTIWDGADANFYDLADKCWDTIDCWKVTMNTPVSMECVDEGDHPVNHNHVCFNVELDGDDTTQLYCEYFSGDMNGDGYCCVESELPSFMFHEESEHNLKYYCVDILGNEGAVDDEKFKVTGTKFVVPLYKKWNLVSVPFILLNDDPEEVFKDVDDLDSVWAYDSEEGEWLVWSPDAPSSLNHIKPGWGYWVLMNGTSNLTIGGSLMNPKELPASRVMVPGWNLIGYYGTQWESFDEGGTFGSEAYCALGSLIDTQEGFPRWSSLWGYENDGINSNWETLGACIDNNMMYAGKGYWVELDVDELYVPSTVCLWNSALICGG